MQLRLFFILLFCALNTYSQEKGLTKESINPSFENLRRATLDNTRDSFEVKYGFSINDLQNIFKYRGKKINNFIPKGGISLCLDTMCYFLDTTKSFDLLGHFPKNPGGFAGWVEKEVIFMRKPDKGKEVTALLNKLNVEEIINVPMTSDTWTPPHVMLSEDFYTEIKVPRLSEDSVVSVLRNSDLFVYVSRSVKSSIKSNDRVGYYFLTLETILPISHTDECYAQCILPRNKVSSGKKPTQKELYNYIDNFFINNLKKPNIELKIIAKEEYDYIIKFVGPSQSLSCNDQSLWEKFELEISFQNGFNIPEDSIEMRVRISSISFAKGEASERIPPDPRFQASLASLTSKKKRASNFISEIIQTLTFSCNGKVVKNCNF